MLTVIQRRTIPAPITETWRYLTEPALVSEWFADVKHLADGELFRFDFGDGDYFEGQVCRWEAPTRLGLRWKFMGIGPEFNIEYSLQASGESSEVTVRDTGSLTAEEAQGIKEGWNDFLSRLQRRVRGGEITRYEWSQSIGTGALVDSQAEELANCFRTPAWWHQAFPTSVCALAEPETKRFMVTFVDHAWGARETQAVLSVDQLADKAYVGVVHTGWDDLAAEIKIAERRRYAGLWEAALKLLEREIAAKA